MNFFRAAIVVGMYAIPFAESALRRLGKVRYKSSFMRFIPSANKSKVPMPI